ncbi:hypothetical protein [Lacticaseibacillus suibinensis]|uniref:hypothetical protein n=1 Tax=Lacticaseibacillus suibinensis TaxID=2486011 RepID=UPI000F79720D|nr:hypothetical protein [Lacticaseibacillus suibinensis]
MRQSRKQNRMQHGTPIKRVLFSVLGLVAAAGAGVVLAFVVPSQTTSKTSAPDTAEVKSAKTKAKTSSRTASSAASGETRFVGVTQTGRNRAQSKAFIEDSGLDDTGFTKVEFPDGMMGNRFRVDSDTQEYAQLEFRYNRLISWGMDGIQVSYGYNGAKRPAAD